jgi:NAD(P)-dependent dehydrogenase (short-subunit alcohol dehydrogenase family)
LNKEVQQMANRMSVVIVGATSGIGRELARFYAERGHEVVLSGRDAARAQAVAAEIGGRSTGIALELARPEEIAAALGGVGRVDRLVLAAIDRDQNSVRDYDLKRAAYLVTLKLLGYTEVVHTLLPGMHDESSIVLFGGLASLRPYQGSTTVTTVNGGVSGLCRTLAVELAPIRVNAVHPGFVGDSPVWSGKPHALEPPRSRTPTGRLATMQDVVGAVDFLLTNRAVNGVDLPVDGGWLLR